MSTQTDTDRALCDARKRATEDEGDLYNQGQTGFPALYRPSPGLFLGTVNRTRVMNPISQYNIIDVVDVGGTTSQ